MLDGRHPPAVGVVAHQLMKRLAQADEADAIGLAALQVVATFQDNEAGIDPGRRKPALHGRLDDGDDAKMIEQKTLQRLAIDHIEPAIGHNKAQTAALAQKSPAVEKEIGIETGPTAERCTQALRQHPGEDAICLFARK